MVFRSDHIQVNCSFNDHHHDSQYFGQNLKEIIHFLIYLIREQNYSRFLQIVSENIESLLIQKPMELYSIILLEKGL